MHCFVGNLFKVVSLPKIIKFGRDFTKLYQLNIKQENVQFFGSPCMSTVDAIAGIVHSVRVPYTCRCDLLIPECFCALTKRR